MAKQNTKTAAAKPKKTEPMPAVAEQPTDIAPEQPLAKQEPNGNDTPEQAPVPADPVDADAAPEQVLTGQEPDGNDAPEQVPTPADSADPAPAAPAPTPTGTKAAAAKSAARGAGKAPAAKAAKTVRETAAQSVAREVFKRHPDRRTLYVTSDGTPFFVKCDADNHARTLNDPAVTTVTNETHKA